MYARVSALNSIGWNQVSNVNSLGATIRTEPVQMSAPTRGSQTSETQVEVEWTALTAVDDLRGSVITSYHLQWDEGTTGVSWYDLTGFSMFYLGTSFIVTSGLLPGYTYQFRVRAENAYGFGSFSTPSSIRTSDRSQQMQTVITSVSGQVNVRITWLQPYDNSEIITAYKILIQQSNRVFSEQLASCDGSQSTIMTQLYCDIPMATLSSAPYSLIQNALVVVRASALNEIGWSDLSLQNTIGA